MAISNNPLLNGVTGAIGQLIVVRKLHEKQIISAYPDMSRRKFSEKQLQHQARMPLADDYAKDIIADEQQRNAALVRLNVTRNKLYTSLIKEYFRNLKAEQVQQQA